MTENKKFEYTIGGKKYTQEKLVLGQYEQLLPLIDGLSFSDDMAPFDIIRVLGGRISKSIAIALKCEGQDLKDKDMDALNVDLKFSLDIETTIKIAKDFFLCNPVSSLLSQLDVMMEEVAENIDTETQELEKLSASSQKETSQSETPSSGDTTSKSANPTSDIATEK